MFLLLLLLLPIIIMFIAIIVIITIIVLLFLLSLLPLLLLFYYYVLRKLVGKPRKLVKAREVFQPKMPYYAKMGACPMKNSAMTLAFM